MQRRSSRPRQTRAGEGGEIMDETTYDLMGITVTCKDGIEYMPGLFGMAQAIGFCSGRSHPDPLLPALPPEA